MAKKKTKKRQRTRTREELQEHIDELVADNKRDLASAADQLAAAHTTVRTLEAELQRVRARLYTTIGGLEQLAARARELDPPPAPPTLRFE